MTDLNTDKTTDYGMPYKTDFHDEFEIDFHAHEENDPKLGTEEEWKRRHSDHTLELYCDNHPSAPECKVFDD